MRCDKVERGGIKSENRLVTAREAVGRAGQGRAGPGQEPGTQGRHDPKGAIGAGAASPARAVPGREGAPNPRLGKAAGRAFSRLGLWRSSALSVSWRPWTAPPRHRTPDEAVERAASRFGC